MSPEKLPDGWKRARFGDVVRNVNENSRDPKGDGLGRVVGLDHLDPGSLRLQRWDDLDDLTDGTSFTRKFRVGQVLFGKRRAYQRKVAVPDFDGICSGDILVFEPSDNRMLARFLPYVVQSDGFFDHALGTSAGSLSPRTKWAELAKYEFPLPPTEVQLQIVGILGAVDRLTSAYKAALESTREALEAALQSHFSDTPMTLGDVLREPLRNGITISPVDRETNVWALTVGSADEFGYRQEGMKCVSNEVSEIWRVHPGDLFVTRSNTPERVGLPFRFPGSARTVVFSDLLIRITPDPELIRPAVLEAFLRSRPARKFVQAIAAGTSASMKKINGANLRRMPVPRLSPTTQDEVELTLDRISAFERLLLGELAIAAELRNALLNTLLGGTMHVQ